MIDNPIVLLRRAKDVLQTEGFKRLPGRSFRYFGRHIVTYANLYLYEQSLQERNEVDFLPRIKDFTFKIVSSNEEAGQLAAVMGCDFRKFFGGARKGFEKGAVAFCVFINGEIAHIAWVGTSKEAKNTFDPSPYHVDFSNGEACTGGTFTVPKYRGLGLMAYVYFKRFEYLRDKGFNVSRNAVAVDNIVSQRVHAKFSPRIRARARHLRLLGLEFWRETPLERTDHTG